MLKISKFDKIIAANWKLNGSFDFVKRYLEVLNASVINSNFCGIICPPAVYLQNISFKSKSIFLGGQNCSDFEKGAYTGEISPAMLKELYCQFCIVGHSERRKYFNESSQSIKKKSQNLMNLGIIPIICIGETLEEKNKGLTKDVLAQQIVQSTPMSNLSTFILAYEPIWAIGTGLVPNMEEINDIHNFIKKSLKDYESLKIIYGGSVNSTNSQEIMKLENVNGLLVGGASLNPEEFLKILNLE